MPRMNELMLAAKDWEQEQAARFGRAVAARRKALGLTGVDVVNKTTALGYPITRSALGKIETGSRAGKLDVAELLVLAAALDMPPAMLLYPDLVDGPVRPLPIAMTHSLDAVQLFNGEAPADASDAFLEQLDRLKLAMDYRRIKKAVTGMATDPLWVDRPEVVADLVARLAELKADALRAGMVVDD